jgi:trimethylamine--corrinoid protein Co-methyltransferase
VGPGGDFLSTGQTMEMFKTEHWLPDQCNRDNLETWLRKGGKDWGETCTEKAREILKTHTPAPLSDAAAATLSEIRSEAEAKLKDHQFRS